ncbi:MAG: protein kinase [Pirellulaceae bacterium]|nr:MAG: protein kinase [Pirellulaceae bacterium]
MLRVSIGQYSDAGVKPINQDFHGCVHPWDRLLLTKGVAVALADGISSSEVSQIAAETAVKSLLTDYYATSEAWPVKTAVHRVLTATNSWLYAQSRRGPYRFDLNRGYVCAFSAVVIKSRTAHLFQVGDVRICYLAGEKLQDLTDVHPVWVDGETRYLTRAMGMREHLELDYHRYMVEPGTILVLMTDGVYEHASDHEIARMIREHANDLDRAAQCIVQTALNNGSGDNLTIQIVRVDEVPSPSLDDLNDRTMLLPLPPPVQVRSELDGYRILRELHHSPRSHVFLAQDRIDGTRVVLKIPAADRREDSAYLERFLMEEWVASRIDHPCVVKAVANDRPRSHLYTVFEYVDGQTLEQWMRDHPQPELETVRRLVEQLAKGLRALHRQEIVHQDLRPANILIDATGNVKLIDFGSARVAGLAELAFPPDESFLPGADPYMAPECFLGQPGTMQSDLYSLGVITYQMLSGGALPYGTDVAKISTRASRNCLRYRSLQEVGRPIPLWADGCIKKAVHPKPEWRYDSLSEFLDDLRHPNPDLMSERWMAFLERHPLLFWKTVSLVLLIANLVLLYTHPGLLP